MIKVEKTAKTLDEGIQNLMAGAKQDYVRMSTMGGKELTGYSKEQVDNTLLNMIDINMKNAINKIINDYKAYQQTGVIKIK